MKHTPRPLVQPDPWIAVADRLPPEHQEVLILVADPSVAIYAHPTCARLQVEFRGTPHERNDWWAGVPGNWMRLPADGWDVTHWTPIPAWRKWSESSA